MCVCYDKFALLSQEPQTLDKQRVIKSVMNVTSRVHYLDKSALDVAVLRLRNTGSNWQHKLGSGTGALILKPTVYVA